MDQGDRRNFDRKKRRIPCQLWVGEREHHALVLDLSSTGLFIQTRAKAQRGDHLKVRLAGTDGAPIDLVVEVARTNHVPQDLLAAAKGGIGARLVSAPKEYLRLVASLGLRDSGELVFEPEPEQESGRRFRVHVAQTSGPRSRRVELIAPDAETASARAIEELGDGWKVLRVESA